MAISVISSRLGMRHRSPFYFEMVSRVGFLHVHAQKKTTQLQQPAIIKSALQSQGKQ